MPVYTFKVMMEDDEDVMRSIEIRPTQTFIELHDTILKSISFDQNHEASFYVSDDLWRRGREISKNPKEDRKNGEPLPLMDKAKINAYVNDPHQKFVFIYDFEVEWAFILELVSISRDEAAGVSYPRVVKTVGKAPKQYRSVQKVGSELEDDEFAYLTTKLLGAKEEVEANMDVVGEEDMAAVGDEVEADDGESVDAEADDSETAPEVPFDDEL